MKRKVIVSAVAVAMSSAVVAGTNFGSIREFLNGYEEVPSVSTGASGRFSASIRKSETESQWQLRYSELEGDVQPAHIHFAQAGVNGGISVFLCTNLGNGPAGVQPCPPAPAVISGTIVAADVSPD